MNDSRRQFLKKGLYIAPAILTLSVRPTFAGTTYGGGGGGNPKPTKPLRRWRSVRSC